MKTVLSSLLLLAGAGPLLASDLELHLPPLTYSDTAPGKMTPPNGALPAPHGESWRGPVVRKSPSLTRSLPEERGFVVRPKDRIDYKLIVVEAPNVDPLMIFPRESRKLGLASKH